MTKIDTGIQGLMLLMQSVNNSMSAGFIGKDVKFAGNTIYLSDETETKIEYNLASQAQVTIKIYDESNQLVATLNAGEQSSGSQSYEWDGKDENGNVLPAGKYSYEIEAKDADGDTVSVVCYSIDHVRGVRFENGNAILLLTDQEIYLADIIEILNGNES